MEKEMVQLIETASVEEAVLLEQMVEQPDGAGEEPVESADACGKEADTRLPEEEELSSLSTDITHRLVEEFFQLREEFPAIRYPEQLPDAVLDMAAQQGIHLLDAYLRFRHEERKRVRREEQRRREAAAQSTGSLTQGQLDGHYGQESFLRSFRAALR